MAQRVLLLNLVLVIALGAACYELVTGWQDYQSEQNLGEIVARSSGDMEQPELDAAELSGQTALVHDFFVIGDRDLFSPDRRPAAEDQVANAEPTPPEFPKRPEMQGASEIDGQTKALLTLFDTPKSQGESKLVSLGDAVQGYVVSEITDTTVTLKWNDYTELIDMFDTEGTPKPPTSKGGKRVAAVNIVRIGSQYAAVETTGPDSGEGEGAKPTTQPGAIGGAAVAGARGALPNRRGFAGRGSAASPLRQANRPQGGSGVVGVPGSAVIAQPQPQPQ